MSSTNKFQEHIGSGTRHKATKYNVTRTEEIARLVTHPVLWRQKQKDLPEFKVNLIYIVV